MSSIELRNEQVYLREVGLDDWPDVHAYSQLPEVYRYQPWGPNNPAETRAFVETMVAAAEGKHRIQFAFAALLPNSERVIGLGTIVVESEHYRAGAIGHFLHSDVWGRGLATAIGRLLIAFGFGEIGLHRISGTCEPRNVASARVMQKLGMRFEGTMRNAMLIRDGWRDPDLYSILEQEWRRL